MIRPQLLFGAVMAIVTNFAVFEVAVALAGLPSPLYAAHTVVSHLFDFAFVRFEMGYASAVAVILFLTTYGASRLAMSTFGPGDG
jgi:multiple sugar transport system permease protein